MEALVMMEAAVMMEAMVMMEAAVNVLEGSLMFGALKTGSLYMRRYIYALCT